MISLLLAMDKNRLIGKENQLPWHLPADLKYFKEVTMGHPIVMGRKTFESIGRILPGRENVIVTRNKNFEADGCAVLHSANEIKEYADRHEGEVFVIGGAEIFKAVLPVTNRLYITEIKEEFEGDTFFPPVNEREWELISSRKGTVDEKNIYEHDFLVYEKK
ncbi:dihydrofolate reductase [Bacillus sp. M6-12]|nr:dihydrofolate reductase [Bacillus sp. M6-12]PLS16262.1 dihydrofolate reductase [Bacillus sp. M6-12]